MEEVRKECQHTGQKPANTFVTLEAKVSAVEHITELPGAVIMKSWNEIALS